MLTFNEGVPGAGKTYDAVVHHILPALKKGRKVWARVNGLDHEYIAQLVGKEVDEVRELLVHVPTAEVRQRFRAERDEAGEYVLPHEYRNCLIVIDEAHEFYVAARESMQQDEEQFFAIHRHYGADILLMTQWYKRMHTALRARIERKNVFQKLTAVGMENRYNVTFFHTTAPDKYAKVGSAVRQYVPVNFPAYKGVADAEVQTEVYKGGSRTVWAKLAIPGALMAVGLVVAVWWLWGFFQGDGLVPEEERNGTAKSGFYQPVEDPAPPPAPVAQVKPEPPPPPPDPVDKMTAEQQYVWRMAKTARARVSAKVGEGSDAWGLIEFRERNQLPTDIISTRQLVDMGIEVVARPFGFLLKAGGETIVATAWPTNEPVRNPNHELYRLDGGRSGDPAALASNASNAAVSAGRGTSAAPAGDWGIASYGDMGQQTGAYVGHGVGR